VKNLRRTATVIVGLILAILGIIAAAPAAFAMRVAPPEGDPGPYTPTVIVTHPGMTGWQVALIAIGAALAAAVLATIVVRMRFRPALHSLAS
jgi:hypothetical protein